MTTRDTGTQHKLRMPPELKEKLFESSKAMNRSLNAEIVARLEKSFESSDTDDYYKIVEKLEDYPINYLLVALVDKAKDKGFRVLLEPLDNSKP